MRGEKPGENFRQRQTNSGTYGSREGLHQDPSAVGGK